MRSRQSFMGEFGSTVANREYILFQSKAWCVCGSILNLAQHAYIFRTYYTKSFETGAKSYLTRQYFNSEGLEDNHPRIYLKFHKVHKQTINDNTKGLVFHSHYLMPKMKLPHIKQ